MYKQIHYYSFSFNEQSDIIKLVIYMKEVKEQVVHFTKEREWDQFHSPENLSKSIAIEAGELLECFQWGSNYKKEEVVEELADVVNYCILLANKLDVDIEQIVLDKLEKNKAKYPVEKAKGVSTKYNKL
jgi:dCTP diphosphatase